MAGSITVSSITLDSDNNFSIKSNTGATLFFANTTGIDVANSIGATAITSDKILSIANTKISGNIISSQIASVNGSVITANTIANSAIQTGAVENYLNAGGRPLSNRNLIFNGAMQIAQRNTSVTTITTNDAVLTADRWKITSGSLGTWTMNVESNGPTSTGLRNSANLICTSAQSSPPAGSYLLFKQDMEGQMMQSIKKGTPGAEQVTVSFWVKSSNTGTFIAEMRDNDNSRACSRSFTINSSDTWEKETITFPADTTGQLDNDNARSMELAFWFGSGSDYAGGTLQTTWGTSAGADNTRAAGQLNLANRVGNYIAFTGVQWEVGPVATPFEFRPYGTELALCQRYYWKIAQGTGEPYGMTGNTAAGNAIWSQFGLPVTMRATPTVTIYGTWAVSNTGQPTVRGASSTNFLLQIIPSATGIATTYPNSSDDLIDASAEL
jgi:hypothetical protein